MDKNPSKHPHSHQASLQIAFGTNHYQVELQQNVVLSLEKGGIEQTNMRTPGEERHSSALALNEDRELVRRHMGKEAFAMAKLFEFTGEESNYDIYKALHSALGEYLSN